MSARRSIRILCAVLLPLCSSIVSAQDGPRRIVSLAPSVTEVLFEAGLGPRIAGVTAYCRYPEVIVEFASGSADAGALRRQWDALDSLQAVKTGRVHVFARDFLSVPGPRFVRFAETLARALYPQ